MGAHQLKDEEEGGVVKRRKVTADVTMDLEILDCPICCHPLRHTKLQCTVGHTICSSCHDKLPDKCHFCSVPTVYSRCHMVEHVIESIKVSCSNANRGCITRITYYQKEEHENGCLHSLCFCPKIGCSFGTRTTMKLLGHLSKKHEWHSGTATYKKAFEISFQVGSTVLVGEDGHLFLVNMILELLGGVIIFCCVQPHNSGSKFKCMLGASLADGTYYVTTYLVRSTNLRDGLPKDCFPFHVPKVLLRGDSASTTDVVSVTLTPQ
ncbi:unnamed protein product [Alopecurus aequalis]